MSVISKLIGVWAIGKTINSTSLFVNRLLSALAIFILLTVLSSILFAALLMGSLLLAYRSLLMHGVDMQNALLMVGGVMLALIFVLLGITVHYWKRLCAMPEEVLPPSHTDHLSNIADAFMDGLLHPGPNPRR